MRLIIVFALVIGGFVLLVVAVILGALAVPVTAAAVGVLAAIGVVVLGVALFVDLITPSGATCGLVSRVVFPDRCGGTCPPGQTCTPTATRPYGPFGALGVQAAACACTPVAAPGTPGGGTPGTPGGGTPGTPGGGTPGGADEDGG